MATFVLCSASGAPGVTATALGLTLTWPRDVLLVDADRTPSQTVLAGYLRGASGQGLGLPGLLQAHRERRPLGEALDEQSLPLPAPPPARGSDASASPGRRFVPGFANLGSIDVFSMVWGSLAEAFADAGRDVLVDAGRIGARGLPDDLLRAAERVGVVVRSSLVSLAALRLYLGLLTEALPADRVGLVVVGPGRPYPAREIAGQFGVPVLAEVAWDAAGASELVEGQPLGARWRRTRLARSYAGASERLSGEAEAERARIGVPA